MSVPNGWCEVTVADVTKPFVLTDPKKTPENTFKYVDIGSIDNNTQTIQNPKVITGAEAPSRARRVIHTGDTLFSTVRIYLKNIAIVPEELDGQLTSTGIAILRPNEAVHPQYLFKWAVSDRFVAEVSVAQDGTMYPAVSDRDVADALIRVPPLREQGRIVAKIDSLSAQSKRAREQLDHVPRLVEKYKQAVLAVAFKGELTRKRRDTHSEISAWGSIKAGEIIKVIVAGKNMRCEERPPTDDERGVLKVNAVTWGSFDPQASKTLPKSFTPPGQTRVKSGDLLISRANTLELVGAVVIVQHTPTNLFLSDKILRLEMAEEDKPWMLWYLRSPGGRAAIERSATGNQLSMRNLSQTALRAIDIPWPTERERKAIIRLIETAFAWIDRLASETTSARKLIDHLDQAILAKAFRGELVPQDPNDEPASVLLERIKAQRETKAPRDRKTRRVSGPCTERRVDS
jgi:type I restriction enzyme, S subunit